MPDYLLNCPWRDTAESVSSPITVTVRRGAQSFRCPHCRRRHSVLCLRTPPAQSTSPAGACPSVGAGAPATDSDPLQFDGRVMRYDAASSPRGEEHHPRFGHDYLLRFVRISHHPGRGSLYNLHDPQSGDLLATHEPGYRFIPVPGVSSRGPSQ